MNHILHVLFNISFLCDSLLQIHTFASDPALKTVRIHGWSGGSAPFSTLPSRDIRVAVPHNLCPFPPIVGSAL
jgi:hypothetical protein